MVVPPSGTRGRRAADQRLRRRDTLLHAFATHRRRLVLATLLDADGPLSLPTLARRVAAREETDPADVTLSLPHVELPVLEGAGLVVDREVGIEATDRLRSSERCRALRWVLDRAGRDAAHSPAAVDATLALLADPISRTVLEQLATHEQLTVDELARAVVVERPLTLVTPPRIQVAALELRHNHLPKLLDVGVVERDDGLHYVGNGLLDDWWPPDAFTR